MKEEERKQKEAEAIKSGKSYRNPDSASVKINLDNEDDQQWHAINLIYF